jgi:glycosyltransferase involved in cell wall biosynthesis
LIEAMALGLIPVAADIPGVREWLNEESGFLYRQDDEADLRDKMESLIGSGYPCERMRRRNLDRVKAEAVFEDNVAETVEIMQQLISRRLP